MKQISKNSKHFIYFIGVVIVFGCAYFIFNSRESKKMGIVDLQNQYRDHIKKSFESPEFKLFQSNNWEAIENRVLNPKSTGKQEQFFKTVIHLVYSGKILTKAKDQDLFRNLLLVYLTKQYKDNFLDKKQSKAILLAGKVLSTMPAPLNNMQQYKEIVQLAIAGKSEVLEMIMLEATSRWRTVPPQIVGKLKINLISKDLHKSNQVIQLIQSLVDGKAKLKMVQYLESNFNRIHDSQQPLALKLLVLNEKNVKDIKKLIRFSSQQKSNRWQEAFIFSVEQSIYAAEFVPVLENSIKTSTSALLKKRAKLAMLKADGKKVKK